MALPFQVDFKLCDKFALLCAYIHVRIYVCMCMHMCICVCVCMWTRGHMHVCRCKWIKDLLLFFHCQLHLSVLGCLMKHRSKTSDSYCYHIKNTAMSEGENI